MHLRKAKKLDKSSTWIPLRYFIPILKFRIKNIVARAAKDFCASKIFTIQMHAAKNSIGANPLSCCSVV